MVKTCAYCDLDTAGNHRLGCPGGTLAPEATTYTYCPQCFGKDQELADLRAKLEAAEKREFEIMEALTDGNCLNSDVIPKIRKLREVVEAIPSKDKLHTLIAFFDLEQSKGRWGGPTGSRVVQNDLLRLAVKIDALEVE